jgi:hypothetical protein
MQEDVNKHLNKTLALKKLFGKNGENIIAFIEYEKQKLCVELRDKENEMCGYIIINIIENEYFNESYEKVLKYFHEKVTEIESYGNVIILTLYESNSIEYIVNINDIKYIVENIPENILKNVRGIYGISNAKIKKFKKKEYHVNKVLIENFIEKLTKIIKVKYGKIIQLK